MDEFTKECFLRGFMLGIDYIEAGMIAVGDGLHVPDEYCDGYMKIIEELENMGYPLSRRLCEKTPTEVAHDILDPMGSYPEFEEWYKKEAERIERVNMLRKGAEKYKYEKGRTTNGEEFFKGEKRLR